MQKVLVYTLHKCASMFLYRVCVEVGAANRLRLVSVNDPRYEERIHATGYYRPFFEQGDLFGPIRVFEPPPDNSSCVVHLRDPRDLLVSLFFSFCYSHPALPLGAPRLAWLPAAMLKESQAYWRAAGIDDFALAAAAHYHTRFSDYLRFCTAAGITPLRYEDMVTDFDAWAGGFLAAFTGGPGVATLAHLRTEVAPRAENLHDHRRQVSPGDHRRKLRPRTIAALNEVFADPLRALRYEA